MRILYLHQYFQVNSGGTRSYVFSKYLVQSGHQVTMVTGNKIGSKNIDGICIKSTKTKYNHNFSFFRRIISFIHFMIKSTLIGIKEKNIDIIFATSTPLTIGIPAIIISKLRRKKFIFEVRDVWPDVPIELGIIKSRLLQKTLFLFEKYIYKNAAHIIVLSKGMEQNLIKKGVSPKKISVITNMSMNDYYDSINIDKRKKYKDKLVCIHPGTMGIVNGLDFILDVAKQYYDNDILYLLIGEGNQKHKLINRIQVEDIKNVIIQDSVPKNEVIKKIKQADVGIMTVADYPILKDNSANKFFDYLAAGLPVLINYSGWQKDVLDKFNAGKSFNYHDKEGFYKFLVKFKNDRQLLTDFSNNAKKLALEKYDSDMLAQQFEEVLKKVVVKNK